MAETAAAAAHSSNHKAPWDQQPGENDLWYARFLRFAALGPSRSVSLVAKGRRNAYPIPAHWPIQAKQYSWRERATALDDALRSGGLDLTAFNTSLAVAAAKAPTKEAELLTAIIKSGGYVLPPSEEDYGADAPRVSTVH